MPKEPVTQSETTRTAFSREVKAKAARRLRAQRHPLRSIWLGFGVTGVIGWSIAMPSLVGALLGLWLDRHYPSGHSWTLMLLVAGLCIGCYQAWNWVAKEDKAIHEDVDEQNAEKNDE